MTPVKHSQSNFELDWDPKKGRLRRYADDVINSVIDAFKEGEKEGKKKGFKEGVTEQERLLKTAFSKNLNNALEASRKIYQEIESEGIQLAGMHMKVESLSEFVTAIVIPPTIFYSDSRRRLTEKIIEFEEKCCEGEFHVTFRSIPAKIELSIETLISDGYIFRYVNSPSRAEA